MDSAVPSAFIATLPPFQFHSGSTENFSVKGPDIGELIQLIIQVRDIPFALNMPSTVFILSLCLPARVEIYIIYCSTVMSFYR